MNPRRYAARTVACAAIACSVVASTGCKDTPTPIEPQAPIGATAPMPRAFGPLSAPDELRVPDNPHALPQAGITHVFVPSSHANTVLAVTTVGPRAGAPVLRFETQGPPSYLATLPDADAAIALVPSKGQAVLIDAAAGPSAMLSRATVAAGADTLVVGPASGAPGSYARRVLAFARSGEALPDGRWETTLLGVSPANELSSRPLHLGSRPLAATFTADGTLVVSTERGFARLERDADGAVQATDVELGTPQELGARVVASEGTFALAVLRASGDLAWFDLRTVPESEPCVIELRRSRADDADGGLDLDGGGGPDLLRVPALTLTHGGSRTDGTVVIEDAGALLALDVAELAGCMHAPLPLPLDLAVDSVTAGPGGELLLVERGSAVVHRAAIDRDSTGRPTLHVLASLPLSEPVLDARFVDAAAAWFVRHAHDFDGDPEATPLVGCSVVPARLDEPPIFLRLPGVRLLPPAVLDQRLYVAAAPDTRLAGARGVQRVTGGEPVRVDLPAQAFALGGLAGADALFVALARGAGEIQFVSGEPFAPAAAVQLQGWARVSP